MDWKRVSAVGLALAALFCGDAVWAQTAAQPRFGVTRPAQSQLSVKYADRTAWLGVSDEETSAAEPAPAPAPAAAKTAVPTPALNAPAAAGQNARPNKKNTYRFEPPTVLSTLKGEIPKDQSERRAEFVEKRREELANAQQGASGDSAPAGQARFVTVSNQEDGGQNLAAPEPAAEPEQPVILEPVGEPEETAPLPQNVDISLDQAADEDEPIAEPALAPEEEEAEAAPSPLATQSATPAVLPYPTKPAHRVEHERPINAPTFIPKKGYRTFTNGAQTPSAGASSCGYVPGMGAATVGGYLPNAQVMNGYVYAGPTTGGIFAQGPSYAPAAGGIFAQGPAYAPAAGGIITQGSTCAPNCSNTPVQPTVRCYTNAAELQANPCNMCAGVGAGVSGGGIGGWGMGSAYGDCGSACDAGYCDASLYGGAEYELGSCCAPGACVMSGLIAEFEWLAWQTDFSEKSYAFGGLNGDHYFEAPYPAPSGSGLRAKLGYRAISGWDLLFTYTWFDADKALLPEESPNSYVASDVNLNVYDLEVGHWNMGAFGGWRPFIGFRWTQLEEEFLANAAIPTWSESVAASSRVNAYALRLGLEWKRDLFGGFQAYAKGGGSVGVGDSKQITVQSALDVPYFESVSKKTFFAPSVEAAAGLAWKRGNFEVHGGYEFNDWFNASRLMDTTGDFMTHGWFVGVGWNR